MSIVNLGVKTRHRDFQKYYPRWEKIRKVLDSDCKEYLRDVGKNEKDKTYGAARQKEYEDGAILYNFTARTLSGMVGSVTSKTPTITLPDGISYMADDSNGQGKSLMSAAADALREVMSVGRGAFLVDVPNIPEGTVSLADQQAGAIRPYMTWYDAECVVNWRKDGTQIILLELFEYESKENEFYTYIGERYRVCELVDGYYRQRVYEFEQQGEKPYSETIIEPRIRGQRMDFIPIVVVGSNNNDLSIDPPPLTPLAELNIGHYRNSADNEEASFVCGQPTMFLSIGSNMSHEQFAEANPGGVKIGCRVGHVLGDGGQPYLVQANEVSLPLKNMELKEQQAIQIGAQLITPSQQITAEAARIQRGADTSVMGMAANNVSEAIEQCLVWCAEIAGATGEVVFELNTEFFLTIMNWADAVQAMTLINAGLLPRAALWQSMRDAGLTNWTDDELQEGIDNAGPSLMAGANAITE